MVKLLGRWCGVLSENKKYHWEIEFIGDQNLSGRYSLSEEDRTVKKLIMVENLVEMWTKFVPLDKSELSLGLINVCDG